MYSRSRMNTALTVVSVILAVISVAIAVYYTVGPAAGEFHADCSDTLYWANASYESGQIVSDDFAYSALLPFSGQTIMIPLIAIFGFSMTAHVVGMVIFLAIFIGALYFLFRSLDFDIKLTFFSIAVTLMFFSMSAKLREMFFGHVIYYSLGILLFSLILGLILRAIRHSESSAVKSAVYLILATLLAVATATDGVQVILLSIAPVIFALVLERFFDGERKLFSRENKPYIMCSAVLCAATVVGLFILKLISHGVTAGYASGYSTYDSMNDWAQNILSLPKNYFSLIGVAVNQRDPLFNFASIINILRIGFGLVLFIIPLILLARYRRIKLRSTRLMLLSHLFVCAFVLFGCIFGTLATANWRLVPVLGTAILCTLSAVRESFEHSIVPRRTAVLILSFFLVVSVIPAVETLSLPIHNEKNAYLYELSEYIEEKGLTYGYADYWESQAISVINGPDTKVRCILLDDDGNAEPYYYQTSFSWYGDQEGVDRYFVLLDTYDHLDYTHSSDYFLIKQNLIEEVAIGDYFIMIFDVNPMS